MSKIPLHRNAQGDRNPLEICQSHERRFCQNSSDKLTFCTESSTPNW